MRAVRFAASRDVSCHGVAAGALVNGHLRPSFPSRVPPSDPFLASIVPSIPLESLSTGALVALAESWNLYMSRKRTSASTTLRTGTCAFRGLCFPWPCFPRRKNISYNGSDFHIQRRKSPLRGCAMLCHCIACFVTFTC